MISNQVRKVLDAMGAKFYGNDQRSIAQSIKTKQLVAREVHDGHLLSPELLRRLPCLYVASDIDFAYPLSLGCRKIHLLDPCFGKVEAVVSVMQNVEKIIGREVTAGLSILPCFNFSFDFGQGEEQVEISCVSARYKGPDVTLEFIQQHNGMEEAHLEALRLLSHVMDDHALCPDYTPTGELGMLLSFNSLRIRFDHDQKTMQSLVPGGYVLGDHPKCITLGQQEEMRLEEPYTNNRQILSRWYERNKTFRYIPFAHAMLDNCVLLEKR